jgi:hypothetical protein
MSRTAQSIHQQLVAQRRRALAPANDPVRRDFDLGLADRMEAESQSLLTPSKPLRKGLGGEIVPALEDGSPGLELTLQEPDFLSAEASLATVVVALNHREVLTHVGIASAPVSPKCLLRLT